MSERWKEVAGWPGYEISNLGRLRSWRIYSETPRILKGGHDKDGYRRAVLTRGPRWRKSLKIPHMVAAAFLPPKPAGTILAHHNGRNTDDRASNLRWKTQRKNIHDKFRHGTMPLGEKHHAAKLTSEQVRYIRASAASCVSLAKKFRVTKCSISAARTRRTWKHLV